MRSEARWLVAGTTGWPKVCTITSGSVEVKSAKFVSSSVNVSAATALGGVLVPNARACRKHEFESVSTPT